MEQTATPTFTVRETEEEEAHRRIIQLKSGSLTVIIATIVIGIWGFTLLFEELNTASLSGLLVVFGHHTAAGIFCLIASVCSFIFLLPSIRWNVPWTLALLFPQQFILMTASLTSFHCVLQGQFADKVARSPAFILDDQAWVILLAYFHWVAMITWVVEKMRI